LRDLGTVVVFIHVLYRLGEATRVL